MKKHNQDFEMTVIIQSLEISAVSYSGQKATAKGTNKQHGH